MGIWRSAHDPDATSRRRGAKNSLSDPRPGRHRYGGRDRYGSRSRRGGGAGGADATGGAGDTYSADNAGGGNVDDHTGNDGSGGTGGDGAEAGGDGPERKKQRAFWKELPLLIGIALVLALLIKTFLVQAFSIPSESMMNTLQRGDRVLVDKLTPWFGSEPERGEVVVFHDPGGWLSEPAPEPNAVQRVLSWIGLMPDSSQQDLIKRVIAVGGDTVECKKGGKVS